MLNPVEKTKLTVYVREECHLCQNMVASLQALQSQLQFEFEVVDIDNDPALVRLYGERIPVLVSSGKQQHEICHYQLDVAALDAYFAKIR